MTEHNEENIVYGVQDDEAAEGIPPESLICPSREMGLTAAGVLQAIHVLTRRQ